MTDSLEVLYARMDERLGNIERGLNQDLSAKCKRIDGHEDRLKTLESHDFAEMAVVAVGVVLMGWLIAAGFIHA